MSPRWRLFHTCSDRNSRPSWYLHCEIPDEAVRESAFSALAGMEDDDVTEALGAVMADTRVAIRLAVVEGLADIDGAGATALLRRALTDADESVRKAAAEALESRKVPASN